MASNIGLLTANNTSSGDEMYTPYYLAEAIIKYIPKQATVWCPFDKEWSSYVTLLKENGNKVIYSHIDYGQDFFEYEPIGKYDIIVSNPPFSKKDKVLKRLYELDKPFAILFPLNGLQRKGIVECYNKGIQLLSFDLRAGFHNLSNMDKPKEGAAFASLYFCRDVLPKDLIIEHLKKYDRSLLSTEVTV